MTELIAAAPGAGAAAVARQPADDGASPRARPPMRLALITGLSGAGRSAALRMLEDLGFEAVDNLPLSFFRWLVQDEDASLANAPGPRRLALGIDSRTRGFEADAFLTELAAVRARAGWEARLVFLDCADDVLLRRYTETRRRHPLAGDRPVIEGVRAERRLLEPLRATADEVIDTSALTLAQLKDRLARRFGDAAPGMTLTVTSFSYKLGLPPEADLVLDVRFLRNPHYDPALRPKDGRDPAVAAHIAEDPDYPAFIDALFRLMDVVLPRYVAEGKSYLTVAIGCTGGKHRSVHVAERLAAHLAERGFAAGLAHRDVIRAEAAA